MHLHVLKSFVAVSESNSVSRAANRLGYAQPTVSEHLRQLEVFVGGATLVERCGLGVRLTEAGLRVALLARVIVLATDELHGCCPSPDIGYQDFR